ncbi:ABC transporter ATP-binding protein [Ktedonosporobacter rubrisoli]|uniref:ABC transporter ATP-binding protein n=1 Tax=Ktedonosporobacter rubrisoli TaxID=2509675 RepID=A0A4P6K508_KTERU|nr:ABC transporter ATP-binding protein [Ktedonosporobacter rubrisoli]
MIEIEDLAAKYPGRKLPVLQGVNLQLKRGETVLLLGASGSGKSTLGLTLNGLIPHEVGSILNGQIHVDGLNTQQTTVAELARRVGIVFQDPDAQFATLTVEDEIVFGLENLCLPPSEMEERMLRALAQVGLPEHRYRRVDQLSGGEKQRIALAALLAMEPQVLVFDEPTANLDPIGTRDVFALIRECKVQTTHTIVLIEHKLDDLMDLIDRVIVLGPGGSLIADGTPRAIFRDSSAVLREYGIWMPQVCLLAHRLREQGIELDPFPITPAEAEVALRQISLSEERPTLSSSLPDEEPASSQPAIEVRELSFRRGRQTILDRVSLTIPQGDFLAIVGANGAGKTTLAQHLVDILHPSPKTVFLQGQDLTRIAARDLVHKIGYVFQNPEHQFITDSVADEVAYGLRVIGLSAEEITERTNSLLERFGLLRFAPANPFTLSHGEKRRLSVATMLAVGQQILLLDEPTFGQDQGNAEALLDLLCALHAEGRTIVMVTHDMTLVARYARHVAVMNQGKIIFHGTPAELFKQPELLMKAHLTLPPLTMLANRLGQSGLLTLEEVATQCLAAFASLPQTRKEAI